MQMIIYINFKLNTKSINAPDVVDALQFHLSIRRLLSYLFAAITFDTRGHYAKLQQPNHNWVHLSKSMYGGNHWSIKQKCALTRWIMFFFSLILWITKLHCVPHLLFISNIIIMKKYCSIHIIFFCGCSLLKFTAIITITYWAICQCISKARNASHFITEYETLKEKSMFRTLLSVCTVLIHKKNHVQKCSGRVVCVVDGTICFYKNGDENAKQQQQKNGWNATFIASDVSS